jgi:hypothetical protein
VHPQALNDVAALTLETQPSLARFLGHTGISGCVISAEDPRRLLERRLLPCVSGVVAVGISHQTPSAMSSRLERGLGRVRSRVKGRISQGDLEPCAVVVGLDGAYVATGVAHQTQRPRVLAEHVRREAAHADAAGMFGERLGQLCADATALPSVDNRHCPSATVSSSG